MKTNRLAILALALALSASNVLAQNDGPPQGGPPNDSQNGGPPDGPRGGGRRHRPPPMPIITALDTNHDGIISAAEIANAPAALLTLDKNGDGQLTPDEYMPPRPGGDTNSPPPGLAPAGDQNDPGQGRHHHLVPPVVAALDTNGDGIISADEIANASASLLKLDKNGDGQLTRDEYMPPRPPRDGDGPGDDQRPPPPDGDGQRGPGDGQGPPPPNQNN